LSAEQTEELANEEECTMTQLVEKEYVEATRKVVDFIKQLKQTIAGEVCEIMKAQMQVKREQGYSEAAASDAGISTSGNVNTLSDSIDLEPLSCSPSHNSSHLDDIPLSPVYANLQ